MMVSDFFISSNRSYLMKQREFSMIKNFNLVTSLTGKNGVTALNLKIRQDSIGGTA